MQVRPAVVLARSKCLAVAAALDGSSLEPDPDIALRASTLLEALRPLEPDQSWDPLKLAKWYATIYGGLVLVYTCGPVTPISRVTVSTRLELTDNGSPNELSDGDLLRAWAMIWAGMEREGLEGMSGQVVDRPRTYWRPSDGGSVTVALRGVIY